MKNRKIICGIQIEYCFTIRRNEVLINTMTQISLETIMEENSQNGSFQLHEMSQEADFRDRNINWQLLRVGGKSGMTDNGDEVSSLDDIKCPKIDGDG